MFNGKVPIASKWPIVPLENVLILCKEYIEAPEPRIYPKLSVKLYGKGVVLDTPADGTTLKMKRHQIAKAGQVILSEIWGKRGAIGFVPDTGDGALCTSHFFLFNINEDLILRGWLEAIFKANYLEEQLGAEAFGTTGYAAVRPRDLLAAHIPLPPLSEQRRIVAKIEQLVAKIEEAHGLRQRSHPEVDLFWKSTMRAVFDQLSRSARTITFQEVCDVVRGGSPRPAGNPLYYDGHIPFLKVGDITRDSTMYLTSHTATIKAAGLSKTRMVPADTLLLTNSGATLGVPKICKFETTFNDGIQAFINLRSDLCKPYLYYFLSSKTLWFRETVARGQGQPNLNTAMVKTLQFPCPDIDEQRRIVAYLDSLQAKVDRLKALQAQTAAELEALLPSILDRAFRGEL